MTKESIERQFQRYIDRYDTADPKIALKVAHSYRVAGLCERIAPEGDRELARIIGILHDIGRFEQIERYGTFNDALSVDHAQLGVELLEEGTVDLSGLDAAERDLIITAVGNHSRLKIEDGLTEREELFCKILRDADKIDIMRVLVENPFEVTYGVSRTQMADETVSEAVKECFREGRAVPRKFRQTGIDILVSHICLFFELEFPVSREIVREQGYLDRLLDFESHVEDTAQWFITMREAYEKRR